MSYISKAFVEVSSVEKMRELYIDVKRNHGRPCDNLLYSPNGNVVAFNETEVWSMFSKYPNAEYFIDCNFYANEDEDLAVKLFLTLAEMRDDSGSDTRWLICDNPHFDDMYNITFERNEVIDGWQYEHIDTGLFSIATPLELAEAVQRGDTKLDNHE